MKKILLLVVPLLFLTGCGAEPINKTKTKNFTYYIQDSDLFDIYVDKESCVEYLRYAYGYKGGITPRLNADGTVKLNKICLESKYN